MLIHKIVKLARILRRPPLWNGLVRGVAAGVEHLAPLKQLDIGTVLDVGANQGQFSLTARLLFPEARIVAFEPLPSAADRYESVLGRENVVVHRVALGADNTTATLYVADRPDSSSLLKPGSGQERAYSVGLAGEIMVEVRRLDEVLNQADLIGNVLLKMDVQGAELSVLEGAAKILDRVDYVYSEVSFVELYKGQALAGQVIEYLVRREFDLRGIFHVSHTAAFGATQADALLVRRGRPNAPAKA